MWIGTNSPLIGVSLEPVGALACPQELRGSVNPQ